MCARTYRLLCIALCACLLACGETGPDRSSAAPELAADELDRLASLGYVDWSEALPAGELARSGVVQTSPRAHAGYNLYTSIPSRHAQLIDMAGRVVHTWTAPEDGTDPWHHVEMNEAGELFALNNGPLQKLDWSSRLLWQAPLRAHHDLDLGPDGTIYALSRRITRIGPRGTPVLDDEVVRLSSQGEIERVLRLSDLIAVGPERLERIDAFLAKARANGEDTSDEAILAKSGWLVVDVFHANSIELLLRDIAGFGAQGDVLLSLRSLDSVVTIDLGEGRLVKRFGSGTLDRPHHASVLRDGAVSVFDNGWHRKTSRVLHIDVARGAVQWHYPVEPDPDFFSRRRGSAQQLPNGNVLITESDDGRVFEIDPAGHMVWEFLNPELDAEGQRRARIYRMERIDAEIVEPLLAANATR